MLAIEVLVQAVVVPSFILQQQRRGPALPRLVTALQESFVPLRVADVDPHRLVPAVGDRSQPPVQRGTQGRDQARQRIGEILVFAAAKAVPAHDDAAAEMSLVGIERGERLAFLRREQAFEDRTALRVEVGFGLCPINRVDARVNINGRNRTDGGVGFHESQCGSSRPRLPPDFRLSRYVPPSVPRSWPGYARTACENSPPDRQRDDVVGVADDALQYGILELELEAIGRTNAALGGKGAAEHRAAVRQFTV